MVQRCVAGGCSNTCHDGYSIHRFPKDKILREKWEHFVRTTRKNWMHATEHSVLCAGHFIAPSDFEDYMKWKMGFRKHLDLKKDAVPSIRVVGRPQIKCDSDPVEEHCAGERPPFIARRARKIVRDLDNDGEIKAKRPRMSAVHKLRVGRVKKPARKPRKQRSIAAQQTVSATAAPETPTSSSIHDHNYSTTQSPRTVKRRLDEATDKISDLQKKIKTRHQKLHRLGRKASSPQEVVNTLRDKHLVSANGAEMLSRTFSDVPAEEVHRMDSTDLFGGMTDDDCATAVPQSRNVLGESECTSQQNKKMRINSSVRKATGELQAELKWDFDTFGQTVASSLKKLPLDKAALLQKKIENMIAEEFQETVITEEVQETLTNKVTVPPKQRRLEHKWLLASSLWSNTSCMSVVPKAICTLKLVKTGKSTQPALNAENSLRNGGHEKSFYGRNQTADGEEKLSGLKAKTNQEISATKNNTTNVIEISATKNNATNKQNSRMDESGGLGDFPVVYVDVALDDIGKESVITEDMTCADYGNEIVYKDEICDFIKTEDWDPEKLNRVQQDPLAFKDHYKTECTQFVEIKQEPND